MKIQHIIRLKSKPKLLNALILCADQYSEVIKEASKDLMQVGVTAKGILKYLYKSIQPTTYFVEILSQNLNKIQYRKLLEFYKLDPKDFMAQDPNSLYEESTKQGLKNAAKKIAQERIDKLKEKKRMQEDTLLDKQKKMMEMQRKKVFNCRFS